ncbi:hypothetical protein FJW08_18855 [Mesorhizobium sp. B3-2-1]|uniref:hypothetical protein n=1 Tax=unclassified Mesorhizobium TaxID=325217 RepID=UPI001128F604|nr:MULTISPECIES: hypothetical protein [unclassified Mesorhizobium]MBZ9710895.1 hypothetical protein [Mesorhizobium sp. ESP7-2]TPI29145.1 hypothetical protein FJW08_18855 [Mesorhizobium sp. B3-2-1]
MAIGSCAGELDRGPAATPLLPAVSGPSFPCIALESQKALRQRNIAGSMKLGSTEERAMNSVIYLIGLVVVVLAVLSFLGFH